MNDPVQRRKGFEAAAAEPATRRAHTETSCSPPVEGRWYRWSRYDLLNGVVIPARDAELETYDPWGTFRYNQGKYRTVEQPYVALLNLHRDLKREESLGVCPSQVNERYFLGEPMIGPQNEADKLILGWCNNYGLLGLVSVLSNSIRLPADIKPGRHNDERIVKQRHYFRDGGIWLSYYADTAQRLVRSRAAVAGDHLESPKPPEPPAVPVSGVTWLDCLLHVYEEKPLNHIRDFFLPSPFGGPADHEDVRYPCPNTEGFWKIYGEPVANFTRWCDIFSSSVMDMSAWQGGAASSKAAKDAQGSFRALSALAQSAGPAFDFNPKADTLYENRVSAGLLASYALMFLWDRMDGRRAISCEVCGRRFVSNDPKAKYCSLTHRNTNQKRRSRARATENLNGD